MTQQIAVKKKVGRAGSIVSALTTIDAKQIHKERGALNWAKDNPECTDVWVQECILY